MLNFLYSDFRRLFRSVGTLTVMLVLPLMYAFVLTGIDMIFSGASTATLPPERNLEYYGQYAPIFIGLFTGIFITNDFTEGTMRNRIISGGRRSLILLSSVIVSMLLAFVDQMLYTGAIVFMTNIFLGGFTIDTGLALSTGVMYGFAGMGLAALFAVVTFIFGNNKVSYIIAPVLAVAVRLIALAFVMKLYPEGGGFGYEGAKLEAMLLCDRFLPIFQLTGLPRWDLMSYVIGFVIITVLSLTLGILIFNKKDIK